MIYSSKQKKAQNISDLCRHLSPGDGPNEEMTPPSISSNFLGRSMISRADRLYIFETCFPERRCPICSHLPRAERPAFRESPACIPINGTCLRCFNALVKDIFNMASSEEHQAVQEVRREERSRGVYRRPSEVLRGIRSKAAKQ
jgi:hypothetical protein